MSFLPSCFLLSWFPAHRLLGHFLCDVFPSHSASTVWAFLSLASAVLGLHLVGAELRLLPPGYVQVMASDMLGECVISSFLSRHSKDLKWWTSITAWLQLRVLLGKQRKVYPQGVRAGWPQRRGQCIIFYILFHYGLSQHIECGSPCYTVGPCDWFIHPMCNNWHLLTPNSPSIPPLLCFPLDNHKSVVCSVSLFLFPFFLLLLLPCPSIWTQRNSSPHLPLPSSFHPGFQVQNSDDNDDDDFIIVTVWPCKIFGPFSPFIFIFYPGGKEVIQHKNNVKKATNIVRKRLFVLKA